MQDQPGELPGLLQGDLPVLPDLRPPLFALVIRVVETEDPGARWGDLQEEPRNLRVLDDHVPPSRLCRPDQIVCELDFHAPV